MGAGLRRIDEATVLLAELRADGGPVVRGDTPGEGDLLVRGGRTRHEWLHAVPRDRRAGGARMSVTRHSRP